MMSPPKRAAVVVLCSGALVTAGAVAQAMAHVPAWSTELNWRIGVLDYDTGGSELLLGFSAARNFSGGWGLEADFGLTPGDDFKGYFVHGNGVYNVNVTEWEALVPFLTAGAGLFATDPEFGDGETDAAVNFGGGAKAFLTPRLAIRGELLDQVVFADPDATHNLQLSAGLTYLIRSDR